MLPIRPIASPSLSFEHKQSQSWGKWILEKIQKIWKAFCDLICCRCYRKKIQGETVISSIESISSKIESAKTSIIKKPKRPRVLEIPFENKPDVKTVQEPVLDKEPEKPSVLETPIENKPDVKTVQEIILDKEPEKPQVLDGSLEDKEDEIPDHEAILDKEPERPRVLDVFLENKIVEVPFQTRVVETAPENKTSLKDISPEVELPEGLLAPSSKASLVAMEKLSRNVFSHILSFLDKKSARCCLTSSKELLRNLYHSFMPIIKYSPLDAPTLISLIAAFDKPDKKIIMDKILQLELNHQINLKYATKKRGAKDVYELVGGEARDSKIVTEILFNKNIKLIKEGRFPNLEVLLFSKKISTQDFLELMVQIPKIKVLDMDTKRSIVTDESLLEFSKKCPEIQILSLSGGLVSSKGLLEAFKEGFKNLDYLKLRDSHWVTPEVVKEIFKRLPNLECMFIQSTQLSSSAAASLMKEGILESYSTSCVMNGYYLYRKK